MEDSRVDRRRVSRGLDGHLQDGQRAAEEPAVDDLTVLVNRPVHVTPNTGDVDMSLIDTPPITRRLPGLPSRVGERRREPPNTTG